MTDNIEDEEFYLTTKDFEIFKKEAMYWVKKLGLNRFEWHFNHKDIEERADVLFNMAGSIASVCLAKTWINVKPTRKALSKSAYHEVFEVLLSTLSIMASSRNYSEILYEAETHKVIRTMENTQFDDDYNKRFKR